MLRNRFKTYWFIAVPIFMASWLSACESALPDKSHLNLTVGAKPITIPAKIEAESFNAALDLTTGNEGTECSSRNNQDVDLLEAKDQNGGCAVSWTQLGEIIDYYVLNRSNVSRKFDIDLRVASQSDYNKIVVDSADGKVGEINVYGNGYTPGWQNWVTRSIKGVALKPGLQIIRIRFQGETNLNYIEVKESKDDQSQAGEENLIAEAALLRSCAGCHDYMKEGENLNWTKIAGRAVSIKGRLFDKVTPMPPIGVPNNLQISPEERDAISGYLSGLAQGSLGGTKPIASRGFKSKGMELVRDTMAQNAGHIWGMSFLPDGNILCTLKSGEIKIFDVELRKFFDVSGGPKAAQFGQGGLFDVGLSPDFGDDGLVYITYAKDLGNGQFTTALSRGKLVGQKIENLVEIFVAKGSTSRGEHFGGRIVIDSDSSIWLTVGERNERANAQRLDNHLGKVIHLTAAGKAHPGNPFISGGGLAEIFTYGHRNPQGLAKNVFTDEIWEMEHGPKGGDEINVVKKGLNYGWPLATFGTEYTGEFLAPSSYPGTEQPIAYYAPSIAPSGMTIYASDLMPAWKGLVISGALAATHLNLTEVKAGQKSGEERLFGDDVLRIREVEQAPTGELWYAADTGQLFRIQPKN